MRVEADPSALTRTRWHEYAVRFLFGGLITAAAGLVAKKFGPAFGGLFLAFPAIFPASATLIEKHERERKKRAGIPKTIRGLQAAALDARGVTMGSIGLIGFALVVWRLVPICNSAFTLFGALVVWLVLSVLTWRLRRSVTVKN